MKRCSQCGRTYAEESLAFCLDDGSLLSAPYDPNATLRMSPPTNPTATEVLPSGPVAEPLGNKSKVLYVAIALGALIVGGVIVGLIMSGGGNSNKATRTTESGNANIARTTDAANTNMTRTTAAANTNMAANTSMAPNTNMARPAAPVAAVDISGDWRDQFGFVTHVSQSGDAFQFTSIGRGCRGRFVTSGSGTVRGNAVDYDYTSNYSTGHCAGTVATDGMHITADCLDTACGRFLTSSLRQ